MTDTKQQEVVAERWTCRHCGTEVGRPTNVLGLSWCRACDNMDTPTSIIWTRDKPAAA